MSDRRATIHDGALHVMFDHDHGGPTDGYAEARRFFEATADLLAANGFAVGPCAETAKNYPTLADSRKRGRHGALRVKLGHSGRCAEATFWSDENPSNPHGGEYDFDRVVRMSYLTRKRWEWTRARLLALLVEWAVPLRVRRCVVGGADPLDAFNDGWGADRFERGPDGWPSERELKSWRREDGDGVKVHNGEFRYTRVGGRWVRGRVYGGINGMWLVVSNGRLLDNTYAGALRSRFPGRGRAFEPRERARRIEAKLERAVQARDFLRAHALNGALERAKGAERPAA